MPFSYEQSNKYLTTWGVDLLAEELGVSWLDDGFYSERVTSVFPDGTSSNTSEKQNGFYIKPQIPPRSIVLPSIGVNAELINQKHKEVLDRYKNKNSLDEQKAMSQELANISQDEIHRNTTVFAERVKEQILEYIITAIQNDQPLDPHHIAIVVNYSGGHWVCAGISVDFKKEDIENIKKKLGALDSLSKDPPLNRMKKFTSNDEREKFFQEALGCCNNITVQVADSLSSTKGLNIAQPLAKALQKQVKISNKIAVKEASVNRQEDYSSCGIHAAYNALAFSKSNKGEFKEDNGLIHNTIDKHYPLLDKSEKKRILLVELDTTKKTYETQRQRKTNALNILRAQKSDNNTLQQIQQLSQEIETLSQTLHSKLEKLERDLEVLNKEIADFKNLNLPQTQENKQPNLEKEPKSPSAELNINKKGIEQSLNIINEQIKTLQDSISHTTERQKQTMETWAKIRGVMSALLSGSKPNNASAQELRAYYELIDTHFTTLLQKGSLNKDTMEKWAKIRGVMSALLSGGKPNYSKQELKAYYDLIDTHVTTMGREFTSMIQNKQTELEQLKNIQIALQKQLSSKLQTEQKPFLKHPPSSYAYSGPLNRSITPKTEPEQQIAPSKGLGNK